MILIPGLVGNACLIMRTRLTSNQIESCRTIIYRAFDRIDGDPNGSMGAMTGSVFQKFLYFSVFSFCFNDNIQVPICLMCHQEE